MNGDVEMAWFLHSLVGVSPLHLFDTLLGAIKHKSLESVRFLLEIIPEDTRRSLTASLLDFAISDSTDIIVSLLQTFQGEWPRSLVAAVRTHSLELTKSVLAQN
jgi:hypothetical protein